MNALSKPTVRAQMREFPLFREKLLAGGKPGSVAKHGMVDDRPVDGEGVVSLLRG